MGCAKWLTTLEIKIMRASLPLLILATLVLATSTAAADKKDKLQEARPPVFEALINCRSIADAQERLACYDAKVAAMDEAEKNDELVLADKETMKEARRGLFGFSLPKLKLFDNADGQGESELVAKIASAYQANPGKWTVVLDTGARWVQIDTQVLARDPKQGMEIKIRPAAMGSYFANIGGQRALRMRRVN
jgi:hypothetical protein